MNDGLLISSSTAKTTRLKGLEKLLKPAGGISTASVSSAGGGTPGLSAFAIVDGAKLLQNDLAEQEIMSSALENKIPIVLENSNKEITSALTGTGVDQKIVVLKPEGNRLTLSLVEGPQSSPPPATGLKEKTSVEKGVSEKGPAASVVSKAGTDRVQAHDASLDERIGDVLVSSSSMGTQSMDGAQEEPKPWFYSNLVSLPRKTFSVKNDQYNKTQVFSIMVDVKYQLYATNSPAFKYLVLQLGGSGFSTGGGLISDDNEGRFYLQNRMALTFSPSGGPAEMVIDEYSPKNKNKDGSWTVSSGFEVGGGPNIGKDPTLELKASYNRSTATSINLDEFDVISYLTNNTAEFIYNLAMMEGAPVTDNDMSGELDKSNPFSWRIRNVPLLAKYTLTPGCEIVWRLPADFNGKLSMGVYITQKIRKIYYGTYGSDTSNKWWSVDLATNVLSNSFEVDFSRVQSPKPPEKSIPKFAARVLVEYKPEAGEIFTLRSLGDGTFEILESSTVQIPPKTEMPVATYHTVQQGETLNTIALQYYGSDELSRWMAIYEANLATIGSDYKHLYPGIVLVIPPLSNQPTRPERPMLAYHTVQRGDMLSAISLRYYGSAARPRWYPIYEANKEIMKGGYNDLKPGMVLEIPKEFAG